MKKVTIIGAGFSGLTLAYYLARHGYAVDILEREEAPGGLIGTTKTEWGQVESAANAILADENVEKLFSDLDVEWAERSPAAKKKYIYWERPTRWPLTWQTSWRTVSVALLAYLNDGKMVKPEAGETVSEWAKRIVNREFRDRLLAPALQGIFAGDIRRMSASLVYKSLISGRPPRGRHRGSVAPSGGMGALIVALEKYLKKSGCTFKYRSKLNMPDSLEAPLVVATNAWSASQILETTHPEVSRVLALAEALPLVRVSAFFESDETDLNGFGCLFPEGQGFSSLGVVFENSVFPGSSRLRSESWILGGANNMTVVAWSDEQLRELVLKDRIRLTGREQAPKQMFFTRWQRAIPHYTVEWEKALKALRVEPPLYLHGNYLGQLGLGRILKRSIKLAGKIKERHG